MKKAAADYVSIHGHYLPALRRPYFVKFNGVWFEECSVSELTEAVRTAMEYPTLIAELCAHYGAYAVEWTK